MDRTEKAALIDHLSGVFAAPGSIVIAQNSGLTVAQMTQLRVKLAEVGGRLKVVKNRLAKIAMADKPGVGASGLFRGPVAIAYALDPVAAPKICVDFAKANERYVLLGAVLGPQILDVDGVKALATLPSLDQLRGKLVGLLQAPASRMVGVLQAPAGQIARVLKAYADKDQAA